MMSTPPRTRLARLAAALVLVGVIAPSARAQPAGSTAGAGVDVVPHVAVFTAGVDGYHTYRIPSVIATPSGALLAFAEGRRAGRGDAGDIDLVMKRSDDRGGTWSAMAVIGDNGPNTFGNPCPVVDRTTGIIWLLTTQNRGDDSERAIIDGTSTGSRTVWVMTSADDGRTWSAPANITAQSKRADWTWYATGPGIGIQTASGRLVIPANHALAGSKVHRSHLLLSDDHGGTWRIGGISVDGTNESQVAELGDGRLLLNMRNHPPTKDNFRVVAISDDGGETLGAARHDGALPEPPAQASLLRLPTSSSTGDRVRLLFANPAGPGRARFTLRLSDDDGRTWPTQRLLHDGPAAYSALVALPGDEVGVLYERGTDSPYDGIAFARVSLAWLAAQE